MTSTQTTTPNGVRPARGEEAATCRRMAGAIADALIRTGACAEDDLIRVGFTRDEILLHREAAVTQARRDDKVRQALSVAA